MAATKKSKSPKGNVIKAGELNKLALRGLRKMGAVSDAVAQRLLNGEPVRHRNYPDQPFVVTSYDKYRTYSNGNWVARGKGSPVKSVELHNLIA